MRYSSVAVPAGMILAAILVLALGLLAFLRLHDTVGCAVQNLPAFDWNGFRHCAATH